MYDQLLTQTAELLAKPRLIRPQTQRQLLTMLEEHSANMTTFLLAAAEALDEDELDVLFAAQFTPGLDDQAQVTEILSQWQPDKADQVRLIDDLRTKVGHAVMLMPDATEAKLTLHEVMVDRFVRLLRLGQAPPRKLMNELRDVLPTELWRIMGALLRGRRFNAQRQALFAKLVRDVVRRRPVDRGYLETAAQFVAHQDSLEQADVLAAADSIVKAAHGSVSYARSGHTYWSPDVAQHHHYHGQGHVHEESVQRHQDEAQWLEQLREDLHAFFNL